MKTAFHFFLFLFLFACTPGPLRAGDAGRNAFAFVSREDAASTRFEWSTGTILKKSHQNLYFSFNKKKKAKGVENVRFLVPVDISLLNVLRASSLCTADLPLFPGRFLPLSQYRGPPPAL